MYLYRYLKEWRKNPQWSFACCLALLLPLNDLQGEIRGLVNKNVLKNLLQTGDFEKVTVRGALKDSGAIDVTLEEGELGHDGTLEVQGDNRPSAKYSNKKRHQGTQTESLSLFVVTDATVHELIEETHL